jgi:hypothetical protein
LSRACARGWCSSNLDLYVSFLAHAFRFNKIGYVSCLAPLVSRDGRDRTKPSLNLGAWLTSLCSRSLLKSIRYGAGCCLSQCCRLVRNKPRLARPSRLFLASVYSLSRSFSVLYVRSATGQCLQGTGAGNDRDTRISYVSSLALTCTFNKIGASTGSASASEGQDSLQTRPSRNAAGNGPQWPTEAQH